MKDIKLLTFVPFTAKDECENKRKYLYLKYEYKDDVGNTHNRIFPKVELPIYIDRLPMVGEEPMTSFEYFHNLHYLHCYIRVEDGLTLCKGDTNVKTENGEKLHFHDVNMVDVITKRVTKKMTLSEIEEKLGYKVEVVSEKG